MASRLFIAVLIIASIACIFAEPPVQIDERHLQQPDQTAGRGWQDSVPGLPGRDYPNLTSIPETSFTCAGKTPGGYYADVETRCQVFHVCSTQGSKSSFLCPSGSVFNQRHFVCDWWYDFECEQAVELYSLNDGLDDPESDRPAADPPLQFNSLAGGDLSLASSGYPNNIRDEANLIYEDYASVRPHDAPPSTEKAPPASADSASALDNYSGGRRAESPPGRFNAPGPNYQRPRDREDEHRGTTYRRRPSQGPDNVPRGFSKPQAQEPTFVKESELRGKNDGPSIFINNGLSDNKNNKKESLPLPRENNNYVDNNNYNNKAYNVQSNNKNYNTNSNDQNYYEQSYNNPLPQENNNYVNHNNNNFANNNNNFVNSNNNYVNSNSNNYVNSNSNSNDYVNNNNNNNNDINNNINSNDQSTENYYNRIILDSNIQPINNNNKQYENYQQLNSKETNFSKNSHEEPNDIDSSTSTPKAINSNPTEDDIDRERQREVDSVDLKKQRPQPRQYSEAPFLIREETTNAWRYDLSTSSSGGSPPFPPEKSYLSPDTSSLSKPEEPTTPLVAKQPPAKFLGKRPPGGLPGGPGNGLPGAQKVLVGSDSVAGKAPEDPGSNKIAGATGADAAWDGQDSYLPPQNYPDNAEDDGGNERNWNNDRQWNDGARY